MTNGTQIDPATGLPLSQFTEDYFQYTIDFAALNSGTSQNDSIQIQADSEFKWLKSTYHADIANAAFVANTRPIPNVTIQIVDTGSGRQLIDQPTPIANIFGTGELPFILPIPRIFKARSSMAITVANFDAAVNYNLRLAFIGTKIYRLGPSRSGIV